MKRITLCFVMIICVFIWGGSSSAVNAAEVMKTPQLINSVRNIEVSEINSRLDNITIFTPATLTELGQYLDISLKMLDDKNAEMIIRNKIPEKINYYDNGTEEKFYTTTKYVGTYNITSKELIGYPTTFFAQFKIQASYSEFKVGSAETPFYRLTKGSAAVLACYENGFRNLIITPKIWGHYENPDGSLGYTKQTYPRTIASPTIGTMYSQNTNNNNYYNSATAYVGVEVDLEFLHGTWGNWTHSSLAVCGD